MAVAALPELSSTEGLATLDPPWPRSALFLVEPEVEPEEDLVSRVSGPDGHRHLDPAGAPVARPTTERSVLRARRTVRPEVRRRRRRVGLSLVAAAIVAILAVPLAGLGGRPVTGPTVGQALGISSTLYVVQPGDTLSSIASGFDPGGDPRPLAEALAREIGSSTVVPGERIRIP